MKRDYALDCVAFYKVLDTVFGAFPATKDAAALSLIPEGSMKTIIMLPQICNVNA